MERVVDKLNPSGLCQCGCGSPAPSATRTRPHLGTVKGEPVRFVKGHERRKVDTTDWDAFIVQDPDTHCWVWMGPQTGGDERGHYAQHQGRLLAHRVYYEQFIGPIPVGLELDHLCRNRLCVNPGHLEAVTHAENVRRGESPTAVNAAKTRCKHGHEFTPENTYRYRGKRYCRACQRAAHRRWRTRKGEG